MPEIILISGVSGSGKTTLGNKIKEKYKDVVVIDTDDIYDSAFIELYEKNKKFKKIIKNNKGNPQKMHDSFAMKKRDEIIKKNKDKNIIFVGLTVPFDDIKHTGFFIDISLDTNYRRVNIRTLHDICNQSSSLKKMYESTEPKYIDLLALFKYGIRHKFPIDFDMFKKIYNTMRKEAKKKGYKIMSPDKIMKEVEKILRQTQKGGYYQEYLKMKKEYKILRNQMGSGDKIDNFDYEEAVFNFAQGVEKALEEFFLTLVHGGFLAIYKDGKYELIDSDKKTLKAQIADMKRKWFVFSEDINVNKIVWSAQSNDAIQEFVSYILNNMPASFINKVLDSKSLEDVLKILVEEADNLFYRYRFNSDKDYTLKNEESWNAKRIVDKLKLKNT